MHIYEGECTAAMAVAGVLKPNKDAPEMVSAFPEAQMVDKIKQLLSVVQNQHQCKCQDCTTHSIPDTNCTVCGYTGPGLMLPCDQNCGVRNLGLTSTGKMKHSNSCDHRRVHCPFCTGGTPHQESLKQIRAILGI